MRDKYTDIAAQLWCLPQHGSKEMDVEFAQSIADAMRSCAKEAEQTIATLRVEITKLKERAERAEQQLEEAQCQRDEAFNEVKEITDACFEFVKQLGILRRALEAISNDDKCGQHHDAMAKEAINECGPLSDFSKYDMDIK